MSTGRAVCGMVALVALSTGRVALAAEIAPSVAGYVTLSSGYWRHGLAHTDGASLQIGLDYQHRSGLFAYARAMNVEYPQNLPGQERDAEASVYVGYYGRRPLWSWTASVGRYEYPDAHAYDYGEWGASVGFRDRIFYSVSYSDDYYVGGGALSQELSVTFPLPSNVEIGGALGYFDVERIGSGITYWNVGASKLLGRAALDLRYYDGSSDVRNFLGDSTAERFVLSVSYALRRR